MQIHKTCIRFEKNYREQDGSKARSALAYIITDDL